MTHVLNEGELRVNNQKGILSFSEREFNKGRLCDFCNKLFKQLYVYETNNKTIKC